MSGQDLDSVEGMDLSSWSNGAGRSDPVDGPGAENDDPEIIIAPPGIPEYEGPTASDKLSDSDAQPPVAPGPDRPDVDLPEAE